MQTSLLEALHSVLSYDPNTGNFHWKKPRKGVKKDDVVGFLQKTGYVSICVFKKKYQAHRLAWLMSYGRMPLDMIDHINGIRNDNRLSNLREADVVLNSQNRKNANKTKIYTKLLGAYFVKSRGRWNSLITIYGNTKYLGTFKTDVEAHEAYLKAKRELHEGCTI